MTAVVLSNKHVIYMNKLANSACKFICYTLLRKTILIHTDKELKNA